MRRNVNRTERIVSIAAGIAAAAMLARRSTRRRGALPWIAGGLLARGATGFCPVNHLTGRGIDQDEPRVALSGSGGIKVRESIVIEKPAEPLFDFWRDLRNLRHVLQHVEHVDVLDNGRSHWVVRGPGGVRVSWDAVTINEVRPTVIGWQSLPGSDVVSAGSVHFRSVSPEATEVIVTLQYDPPAGKIGASLAWLAGQGPASLLRSDLRRMKQLIESGRADDEPQPGTGTGVAPSPAHH
jgi:uncharacterized membrane protein